jgi:hypothetical protein
MAKTQTQPEPNGATRTRLVNRNAHLMAAAKIVRILEAVEPFRRPGILRSVQDALASQPELPFEGGEAKP